MSQIVISDTACVAKLAKVTKGHLQLHGLMTDFLPLVVFINWSESVPEAPSQYSHFKVSNHILVYIVFLLLKHSVSQVKQCKRILWKSVT